VDKKNPDPWSKRFSEYFTMPREVDQEDLSAAFGQDKVLDALLSSKIGGLIRKITSTETFEREEKFELTKEERQEAERDIEMERLRSQNPEEFRRREQERAALQYRAMLAVPSVPPTGFNQPGSFDGESLATFQDILIPIKRLVKIKVPEHMRDKKRTLPSTAQVTSLPAQPDASSRQ
jgi:hypothetical protein